MDLNRTRTAVISAVVGLLIFCAGVAWIYPPAGLIVLGASVVFIGLFGIKVDR